jgi:hypothetical protein
MISCQATVLCLFVETAVLRFASHPIQQEHFMFKVGFTLPNIIALILGLGVIAYFTLVK